MRNLNTLSDIKQVCLVSNPNSKISVVLDRSFSVTGRGLCVSVLWITLDTAVSIQRGRKLGYALPMRTDYEETSNLKKFRVTGFPFHADRSLILKRVIELKSLNEMFSMRSETDNSLSSCSIFPEGSTSFARDRTLERYKRGEGDFESLRAVLNRNADVFFFKT